jgi:hypothetical protein
MNSASMWVRLSTLSLNLRARTAQVQMNITLKRVRHIDAGHQ